VLLCGGVFALPGIGALIIFILARPQEFLEALQRLPLLYIFCAAAVGGFVVDLRLRRLEPVPAPTFVWVCLFVGWSALSSAVRTPDYLITSLIELGILFILYATIAHGVQRLRTLEVIAGVVMLTCVFLAVVCLHQGMQPRSCVAVDAEHPGEGFPDGRPCELANTCYDSEAEPGAEYKCEKVGLFGTYSIEDRVRYRGELHDPNELAMTVCIGGLSFLIAFIRRKRTPTAMIVAGLASFTIAWCVVMTQSRGGLLVMMIVLGVFFVDRFRWPGLIIAGMAAAPLAAIGLSGRSGSAADASTQLRYEAWSSGLQMFKSNPVFGVGHRMFTEHHYMTAHNSYVLAMAELGFIGLVLFVAILALSVKMLWRGVVELDGVPGAESARTWGLALLASFAAMVFQISTLSFSYHSVLWVMLGIAGAWWSAVRVHKPDFQVRLTARDLVFIVLGCAVFVLVLLPIFLRLKGE